jgi:hypothetical protein
MSTIRVPALFADGMANETAFGETAPSDIPVCAASDPGATKIRTKDFANSSGTGIAEAVGRVVDRTTSDLRFFRLGKCLKIKFTGLTQDFFRPATKPGGKKRSQT